MKYAAELLQRTSESTDDDEERDDDDEGTDGRSNDDLGTRF